MVFAAYLAVQVALYADDLILVATSVYQLQAQLDALHSFCISNHLKLNTDKTKITLLYCQCTLSIAGVQLE